MRNSKLQMTNLSILNRNISEKLINFSLKIDHIFENVKSHISKAKDESSITYINRKVKIAFKLN